MGNTWLEAVLNNEAEAEQEAKRYDLIHKAVGAALEVLDEEHPEFKKSAGAFGDRLARDLHNRIEQAFAEWDNEA